jgi:alpha-glucoside transport system permease protein
MTEMAPADHSTGWRGLLLPLGSVLGLIAIVLGLMFLADQQASANVSAWLYDLIGNDQEAEALRRGGGDRFVAKLIVMAVALAIGVGGIWLIYTGLNVAVERLGQPWSGRLMPWVFVGPALLLLALFLVWPAISTIFLSLGIDLTLIPPSAEVAPDAGTADWLWGLTNPANHRIYLNNVIWLVVGTAGSVLFGLLIAGLVDRVKRESLAKTFIFLPYAISLVGASVIWSFVYAWRPTATEQIGLLNAIWTAFGQEPVAWLQSNPLNTFLLIVVLIWLQTGFAMIVLSAAIKGVPVEIIEAAALDGASERQKFLKITVPMIKGSLITVTITVAIFTLKIFDIVFATTGGNFGTDVVANQMFRQMFQFFDDGRGAVLAVVLFLAVLPLMILNVRQMRHQGIR